MTSAAGEAQQGDHVEATRIRETKSYQVSAELLEFLESSPSNSEILYKGHSIVDCYRGFGSQRDSEFARESIAFLRDEYKRRI